MTSIQPEFDYFLNSLSPDQRSLLDIAKSRQFNDELSRLQSAEIVGDGIFYELTAYVFLNLSLAFRFLTQVLSSSSIDGYDLAPSSASSIFEEYFTDEERLQLLLPKWAISATKTFALYHEGKEFMYLEAAAVTGRVRFLEIEHNVILLTLAGFD